jgi:hypothetical protein
MDTPKRLHPNIEWRLFPKLAAFGYTVTSQQTTAYNCIAYVLGDSERAWWPHEDYYWPADAPMEDSIEGFSAMFRSLGYEPADSADLEQGFEKIVLYAKGGIPTHAAKQLPTGEWTSKLGDLEDISHPCAEALETEGQRGNYGAVHSYYKRSIPFVRS